MNITLAALAKKIGAELVGPPEIEITSVTNLDTAVPGSIIWVEKKRFIRQAEASAAAAVIAAPGTQTTKPLLVAPNPKLAFAQAISLFFPPRVFSAGISPSATVSPTAILGDGVTIQPHVVIEDGVEIGDRSVIQAGSFIGLNSRIGTDCRIYPNVTINENIVVGDRCIIHAGAVLGGDGFGYVPDALGRFYKIPQVGIVVLEDDVEIGCNTTVDRATFGETRICSGVKLDNLVQIAHNDVIGPNTAMAAQVGIAGSTKIGANCMFGGQVGIADHVEVGDRVMMAGKSGLAAKKKVASDQLLLGAPARPLLEMKKLIALQNRLVKEAMKKGTGPASP